MEDNFSMEERGVWWAVAGYGGGSGGKASVGERWGAADGWSFTLLSRRSPPAVRPDS